MALVLAGPAHADAWRPIAVGCSSLFDTGGVCSSLRGGNGLWQVAVAPDGRHAYGSAYGHSAVLLFDRNPATGRLTQRFAGACLAEDPAATGGACVKAKGLSTPHGIVVSPDGRQVYVAAYGASTSGAVAVFDRDPATGDISQPSDLLGCISQDQATIGPPAQGGVCLKGRGLTNATSLAMSPDGQTLVVGSQPIAVIQRNPATGELSQTQTGDAGCIEEAQAEGCADGHGLSAGARQSAFSPDGRSLYVPSPAGGLNIFDRDPATGVIRQKDGPTGCFNVSSSGGACTVEPRLAGARGAIVSPDGNQVYVMVANGVFVFYRGNDGRLAPQSCVTDSGANGCTVGRNGLILSFGAISPDGQTLVANSDGGAAIAGIVAFERDAAGNLSQSADPDGCVSVDGSSVRNGQRVPGSCIPNGGMTGVGSVSFPDNNSLVVASYYGSSVTQFKRDFYPVCTSATTAIKQNTAGAVGLACGDRNGDPLTYEVTSNPAAGSVWAIDQSAGRVFYNPFSGFVGSDAFTYRAIAAGLASNQVTATLNVAPGPVAPPPPPKIETVDAGISYRWSYGKVNFTIRRLVARGMPVGSTFTITCSGKRCPYKRKTIKRSKKSTMNVLNAKSLRKRVTFRAKQTIDFRVAAPGMNTKVLRFKLKSKKQPDHQTYCIPLGGKKIQRTC